MDQSWLTARMVGEIQECIEDGRDINTLISSLQGTSLPGFVEYRCLRRFKEGLLPPLPPAIRFSEIGMAFEALRPTATVATEAPPPIRIDRQSTEFYLLRTEADLIGDRWKAFTIRFSRSAQGEGLDRIVADGLRAALGEMSENAVLHSEVDAPILAGYRAFEGCAQFCVADTGIGVLRSLRSSPDFAHLTYDNEAIKAALRDGVSRYGYRQGGMGFRQIFNALAEQWGQLRFRSGQGCITMDGTDLDANHFDENFVAHLPGFQVAVACRVGHASPRQPLF